MPSVTDQDVRCSQDAKTREDASHPSDLTSKDKLDGLKFLADFQVARVASRHAIEWRLAFGAWAGLIAAMVSVNSRPPEIMIAYTLIVFIAVYLFLVLRLLTQNMYEAKRAYYYRDKAENLIFNEEINPSPRPPAWSQAEATIRRKMLWATLRSHSFHIQILITASLCGLVWAFIGRLDTP